VREPLAAAVQRIAIANDRRIIGKRVALEVAGAGTVPKHICADLAAPVCSAIRGCAECAPGFLKPLRVADLQPTGGSDVMCADAMSLRSEPQVDVEYGKGAPFDDEVENGG
jgi:hypothetical protein